MLFSHYVSWAVSIALRKKCCEYNKSGFLLGLWQFRQEGQKAKLHQAWNSRWWISWLENLERSQRGWVWYGGPSGHTVADKSSGLISYKAFSTCCIPPCNNFLLVSWHFSFLTWTSSIADSNICPWNWTPTFLYLNNSSLCFEILLSLPLLETQPDPELGLDDSLPCCWCFCHHGQQLAECSCWKISLSINLARL